MSAETIPAEVHATMLWALKRWRTSMQPDDLLRAMLEAPVVQGWLADRSTRPAEPAPEVEVGDGEVVAWLADDDPEDMSVTLSAATVEKWAKYALKISPLVRLSTLEAERAKTAAAEAMTAHETAIRQEACRRADRYAERAEEADRLRVEHAMRADAAKAEADELRVEVSNLQGATKMLTSLLSKSKEDQRRALQDRDEAVRVAVEDERDRLYRKANADYIAAEERGDTIAQEAHAAAAYWLGLNDGKSVDDRTIARRARLRADQRAGDGEQAS